ncbi:MAG: hypothetical protein K2K40_04445 [Paramuribaculum sp.]|nr:hypothetical protein [Candidatus Amulumruptor sp.]MDE6587565.1 hypothetical protein [Paramuribaculum sp.]
MLTLFISLCICLGLLALIFLYVWQRTDWQRLDRANERFIDADGRHIYYDRHIPDSKQ